MIGEKCTINCVFCWNDSETKELLRLHGYPVLKKGLQMFHSLQGSEYILEEVADKMEELEVWSGVLYDFFFL